MYIYIYTAPVKVRLLTGASYKYARSNKTVFNNRFKNCSREVSSLFRLSGRLFHTVGAETRKLLGPKRTVRVREMISSPYHGLNINTIVIYKGYLFTFLTQLALLEFDLAICYISVHVSFSLSYAGTNSKLMIIGSCSFHIQVAKGL